MAKEKFFKRFPWVLHLLIMLGISVAVLIVVFIFIRIYARQGHEYQIPDMVGTTLEDAKATDNIGLHFVVMDSVYQKGTDPGVILTQDPKADTWIKSGRKVYITITAADAGDAIMPDLIGLTVRQAVSELRNCGLDAGRLKFVSDPYKNNVLEQTQNGKPVSTGQKMKKNSRVDLVVGLGEGDSRSTVPFVIGKNQQQARRDILTASFNTGVEHFNGVRDKSAAVVYRQEPDYTGGSKYPLGTAIELWYIDADDNDIAKMINDFKVDSSKIEDLEFINDGRPTPDEVDNYLDREW
ncbi:MAG: PASTA domain-containing protein [Bacteroidales bacterium]|nr:PASTA domain-containing protein [Bacteroidales bacterium]